MGIEEKIKNELESHGLTINDLTKQEIEELKSEIEAKEKGEVVIDGVFSNPEIFYRKR